MTQILQSPSIFVADGLALLRQLRKQLEHTMLLQDTFEGLPPDAISHWKGQAQMPPPLQHLKVGQSPVRLYS